MADLAALNLGQPTSEREPALCLPVRPPPRLTEAQWQEIFAEQNEAMADKLETRMQSEQRDNDAGFLAMLLTEAEEFRSKAAELRAGERHSSATLTPAPRACVRCARPREQRHGRRSRRRASSSSGDDGSGGSSSDSDADPPPLGGALTAARSRASHSTTTTPGSEVAGRLEAR